MLRLLAAWLCLGLLLGAQSLPGPVVALLPSYDHALEAYESAKKDAQAAEADSLPKVQEVSALKAQEGGWLRDLRLRRGLSQLQESLDNLNGKRASLDKAKQDLFLQLSALEAELRSSLEKELGLGPKASGERIKAWFAAKGLWDAKLEELGATDSKPFPMVDVPKDAPSPQIQEDRHKALQAQGIQLEAWADMLASDLQLWKRAAKGHFVAAKAAAARIKDLENLSAHVAALIRDNEAQQLSKN